MYTSETNWWITIKLYQKHHCGGGLPASDFEADRIRGLVAMATDNIDFVWRKRCPCTAIFQWIFSILAGNNNIYNTQDYLLQGTRRFGELGGKQWKPQTRDSIYPILFSTYVHFRNFNISHIHV